MYTVTMTEPQGDVDYMANEHLILALALDYVREHGPFSGMEDWDEDNMREWIDSQVEALYQQSIDSIDLYISGPVGHSFTVVRTVH